MKKNEALKARLVKAQENRGDWDYEDKVFTRQDWRTEVAYKDTQLGYFDWVIHNLEESIS